MWRACLYGLKPTATLVGFLLTILLGPTARSEEPKLSIGGYDPVAYFTEGKPVQGKSEFEYLWHRLRWRFANGEHRDLFAKDPDRYTPQYDGYCAMGTSLDDAAHKDTVDPEAWAIVDGKLYLTHARSALGLWRQNEADNIKRADESWAAVKDLPEPVIVGPPCAASPPTTLVALRGGGRWVIVGGQVARDKDGNVVGKGDMRAQIEQVGKNVESCLRAAGATVKDIIWTTSYVTDTAAFSKNADLRNHYFGPDPQVSSRPAPNLPASSTVAVRRLAAPDFLVEVEAIAAIN
jgi:enamine deaminase RidA (YjgF/YER057c/UK114 family)